MSYLKVSDQEFNDPNLFSIPAQYKEHISNIILPYGVIKDRIEKMAEEISDAYEGEERLVCVCILKGAFRFYCDLISHLKVILRHSQNPLILVFDFLQLSSYKNCSTTGAVDFLTSNSILSGFTNQNVLIVEDMIDSGTTMVKLLNDINAVSPKSVKVASLLIKRNPKSSGFKPHFAGFEIPNDFIVGYGCDYNERFRDLDHIGIMNEESRKKYEE